MGNPAASERISLASAQQAWVPLLIGCGNTMRATGPAAMSRASSTMHSELRVFMSVTKLTTYPSSSLRASVAGAIGDSLPNRPSPNR